MSEEQKKGLIRTVVNNIIGSIILIIGIIVLVLGFPLILVGGFFDTIIGDLL